MLKDLMRKERATRSSKRMALSLVLQAKLRSGHLSRERALELQRIRTFRKERIDRDALKLAELSEDDVRSATSTVHGFVGKVSEARTTSSISY